MSIMEGQDDIFREMKAKLISTYKGSCAFWIPAQAINFFLIPPHFRVVYIGTCAFAWCNVLCWIKRMEYS